MRVTFHHTFVTEQKKRISRPVGTLPELQNSTLYLGGSWSSGLRSELPNASRQRCYPIVSGLLALAVLLSAMSSRRLKRRCLEEEGDGLIFTQLQPYFDLLWTV